MRGSKAKAARRAVYADRATTAASRRYRINRETGQVIADDYRRVYQHVKRKIRGKAVDA